MATLEREIEAFERVQPELERHHNGKWVVFHEETLRGTFDSFESAAQEAVLRFGRGPYLIRQIGAPPMVMPAAVMFHRVNAAN